MRARLAELLVESLDADDFGAIEKAWILEAKRRRDEVRDGRVEPIPDEEALLEVHIRFHDAVQVSSIFPFAILYTINKDFKQIVA